jgi:hypothetical protein
MSPRQRNGYGALAALGLVVATIACASAIPPANDRSTSTREISELWTSTPAVGKRDLYWGTGGPELAPKPNVEYQFVSEKKDLLAYSPGYHVRDSSGREWSVKLGDEVRPEVLASRIIWAVGYRQPPVYLVPAWTLVRGGERKQMPTARFRPRTADFDNKGQWSWRENPFVATRPFHGLVVLMAIIGNWDVEDHNTAIYKPGARWGDAKRWYVVRDVGASFSRGGGWWWPGTRNDIAGYLEGNLIRKVAGDRVELAWDGRQPAVFESLPAQWQDAFRAAGYDAREQDLLYGELERRIGESVAFSPGSESNVGAISPKDARVDDRPRT